MLVTVLVVWCLASIPVGVVLGLCIREGKGAGPRPADAPRPADGPRLAVGPRAEAAAQAPVAAEELGTGIATGAALPAQRRPVTLQGHLHDA